MTGEPPNSDEWQVALRQLKREVNEKAKALQASSSFLSDLKLKAQDTLYSTYKDLEPFDSEKPEDRRVSTKIKTLLSSIQTLTSVPQVFEAEPLDQALLGGPRYLSFFGKKGSNVNLSSDGRLASRHKSAVNSGNILFGDFPCRVTSTGVHVELVVKKQFPITQSLTSVDGLTVGFTLTNPKIFAQVPKSCVNVPDALLVGFNGQTMEMDATSFRSTDAYHPGLLKGGDRLSLLVPSYGSLTGRLVLLVNGKVAVISQTRLPVLERHLFLVVDLLGVTEAVSLADSLSAKNFSISDLELLVKQPVLNIKGCFVDKHGSNVKISDDRKMAIKTDPNRDFGNLLTIALPPAAADQTVKASGEHRMFFELKVKRTTGNKNFMRIGLMHSKVEMLPPLISQLTVATWLELTGLTTSTSVGLLMEPHRLSVFLNGVLTATKECAAEGLAAGLVELGTGLACVSLLDTSERLLYTKLEIARVKAVDAARFIQRVYRSVKTRRKWRSLVRVVLVKNNFKKKEENKIEKLLEQQILLQHRLLEKFDKLNDRPINADLPMGLPSPLVLPNRLGAVMKPISSNVSLDKAFRSVVRVDEYKAQLVVSGVESYCKLLFTCDKKTLGVNIGILKDSASFEFLVACNLNGDVFVDGAPGPKLLPKPLHEGEVIEVAVEDRKFVVLVSNKLLCRLDVPAGRSFVPGAIGLELWGGARGVAFFGDPRMQSLLPADAKLANPATKKYNVKKREDESPTQNKYSAKARPNAQAEGRGAESPLSVSAFSASGRSDFSGSLKIDSVGGNFFQKVINMIPPDMLGESSGDEDYLRTQPLKTDVRGSKVAPKRKAN